MSKLPPPENYAVACERIRCLCALHDCSITSNARTEIRNRRVGGRSASKHLIEWGCCGWDLVPDNRDEVIYLVENARRFGFWLKVEEDHVHLQSIEPGSDLGPVPPSV